MHHICTMQIFEPPQNLIQEKLAVFLTELLTAFDNGGQIGLHQFGNYVNVLEVFARLGQNYRIDPDNVLVFEELQQPQLP